MLHVHDLEALLETLDRVTPLTGTILVRNEPGESEIGDGICDEAVIEFL